MIVRKINILAILNGFVASVACLLPLLVGCRDPAEDLKLSRTNMQAILLGMQKYESEERSFPPYANFDENGKPLLSWRVHILPYLDEKALYNRFHLDEPWDSPHNKSLIEEMPECFLDPKSKFRLADGKTHYLGAKGEDFFFTGTDEQLKMVNIRDGLSNTIALLQVSNDRATTWTQPDDWEFDENDHLQGLVPTLQPRFFIVGKADGSTLALPETFSAEDLRAMLTRSANDFVERSNN